MEPKPRTEKPDGLLDRVVPNAWRQQVRSEKVLRRGSTFWVVDEASLDDLGMSSELDGVPSGRELDLRFTQSAQDLPEEQSALAMRRESVD